MNATPYVVFFENYGRPYGHKRFATFAEACKHLEQYEAAHPGAAMPELHNEEGYDCDNSDGLTEDERDIVWSREYQDAYCRTDGCNHGDCEEAAKQAAQMDAAAERHDHYVHDAYDREGDR